jgi:RNA polymerase sigma-70 factor, ECF subfamily
VASLAEYASEIHAFVAVRVADAADADDIAQQALLQAAQSAHLFRGGNRRAWLFTIARNLVVDHYRRKPRYQFIDLAEAAAAAPQLRTPNQVVLNRCEGYEQLALWLGRLTRSLAPEEQVAVLASDAHEYSAKDSALMLQITVPSYRLLLHGARTRLRESTATRNASPKHRLSVRCPLPRSELRKLLARLVSDLAQILR